MEMPSSRTGDTSTGKSEKNEPPSRSKSYPNTQNNFPYSIKSTNSSILSQSCFSRRPADYKHCYVPVTPNRASKHGHSLDLSQCSPKPLPIPPSLEAPQKLRKIKHVHAGSEDLSFPAHRMVATNHSASMTPLFSPVEMDDLPSNPRVWTNSQLASYLVTALRVKSGERLPLPLPVAQDIAAFVKKMRLNGRAFLQLDEEDFQVMGINNLWSKALVNASRNLRRNVLKGKIWGFDTNAGEKEGGSPYKNVFYNSSSSSIEELSELQDDTPSKSAKLKSGRVRSLIANLERTSSSGSSQNNRGSSTSEGEIRDFALSWADDEGASASGSETSDLDRFNVDAATRSQTVPELPSRGSPTTQKAEMTLREPEEMTVEELLAANLDTWGAASWENMDLKGGATIKRSQNMNIKITSVGESFVPPSRSQHDGSGITQLPSPPASDMQSLENDICTFIGSPELALPLSKDECHPQLSDSRSATVSKFEGKSDDVRIDETSRLHEAISLTEDLRARLAIVEKKLDELEYRDTGHHMDVCLSQATNAPHNSAVDADASKHHSGRPIADIRTFKSKSVQTEGTPPIRPSEPLTDIANSEWSANNLRHPGDKCKKGDGLSRIDLNPLVNGVAYYLSMVGIGVCVVVVSALLKRLPRNKA